jgi:hypothetical protein
MAHQSNLVGIVREQVSAHPIDCRRIVAAQDESKVEGIRRQRAITLASHHRVRDVDYPALNIVTHRSVGAAVEQNAIQVEARSPDGVIPQP